MDEPIRVLHILQRMEAAGVQTFLMSIYRKIDRTKVQFDFLVHYKEEQFFDDEIEKLGGRIYKFSVREDYNILAYLRELDLFFKQHPEYKIVHGHMPVLGYLYFSIAKRNCVPVRIAHGHTNQHSQSLKGYAARLIKHLYGVCATDYFACSESAGEYLFGKNKKFKVVRNAICTENFIYNPQVSQKKREELGVADKFVIGHVARFAEHKNHTFLLDVFAEIRKLRKDSVLLLAGTGELRNSMEEKAAKLGIADSVYFLGVREDINELYQAMDAFVFPSIFEGLGIVNIEAQASGLMTFCSSAVPKEAEICPLYTSIPLEFGAEYWAQAIIEKCENREERTDMTMYVKNSGYDVEALAEHLQEFYINKHLSHCDTKFHMV